MFVLLSLLAKHFFADLISDVTITRECPTHWSKRQRPLKIFDAFSWNGESELLYFRLQELNSSVSLFFVAEASASFSGRPRQLQLSRLGSRFDRFRQKMVHVVAELPSNPVPMSEASAFRRQTAQRNALADAVLTHPDVDRGDLVLVNDLDELPRVDVLDQLRRCDGWQSPVLLEMEDRWYDFECGPRAGPRWRKPKVLRVHELESRCDGAYDGAICLDEARDNQQLRLGLFRLPTTVREAGVHMSFFLSIASIRHKLATYAHTQRSAPQRLACMVLRCQHPNGERGVRDPSARPPHWLRGTWAAPLNSSGKNCFEL